MDACALQASNAPEAALHAGGAGYTVSGCWEAVDHASSQAQCATAGPACDKCAGNPYRSACQSLQLMFHTYTTILTTLLACKSALDALADSCSVTTAEVLQTNAIILHDSARRLGPAVLAACVSPAAPHNRGTGAASIRHWQRAGLSWHYLAYKRGQQSLLPAGTSHSWGNA